MLVFLDLLALLTTKNKASGFGALVLFLIPSEHLEEASISN